MKLHREVLGLNQAKALERLAPVTLAQGFYLAGGTALALRFGHRQSLDLDWFTASTFGNAMKLVERIRASGIDLEATTLDEGTVHGSLMSVPTTFLDYPYRRIAPLGRAREGYRLASLDDLATMKLSAIVDRGAKKDFIDVYALVREHKPLHELIRLYLRRFRLSDPGHVLTAMSYFADAEAMPLPVMRWNVTWTEVKAYLQQSVRAAASRL